MCVLCSLTGMLILTNLDVTVYNNGNLNNRYTGLMTILISGSEIK